MKVDDYTIINADKLFGNNPDKNSIANMLAMLKNDKDLTDVKRAYAALYVANELNIRMKDFKKALNNKYLAK